MPDTQTIKVRKSGHKKLRLAAALTNEPMMDVFERAVENELKRLAELGYGIPQKEVKNEAS